MIMLALTFWAGATFGLLFGCVLAAAGSADAAQDAGMDEWSTSDHRR